MAFVQTKAVPGATIDRGSLTDGWRTAHTHIASLEQTDAYSAADAENLPATLRPLGDELLAPMVQQAFALLPVECGIVALGNLIVHQKHINLDYADRLRELLGSEPSAEDVFRFALPIDRRYDLPIKAARTAQNPVLGHGTMMFAG